MEGPRVVCPQCRSEFEISAAIERSIAERLRAGMAAENERAEKELRKRQQALDAEALELKKSTEQLAEQVAFKVQEEKKRIAHEEQRKAREEQALQLRDLQQQLLQKDQKLAAAQKQELSLLGEKRELDEQKKAFEVEKARQIESERQKIRDEASALATADAAEQLTRLQLALEAKDKVLSESREKERKLHAEKIEFEEQKKAFDLELARKAAEVKEQVGRERDEAHRLKEEEKNRQMEDLRRQIDELRRKAEQGSQQLQGEVLEQDLEDVLRRCFGNDVIDPVAKGVNGADVLQRVRDEAGQPCGTIIWESKRTKTWTDGWLTKLKDDKLATKAQIAILVSAAMPKDVPSFECRQNVWVTPPRYAVPLAGALRMTLIETAAARRAADGRHDKMQAVYDYLSGNDFKARVTAIVEAFEDMRKDLEAEKRAVLKAWAKRDKQLERVMANTAGMYGELEGIFGRGLPRIGQLELSEAAEDADDAGGGEPVQPILPAASDS